MQGHQPLILLLVPLGQDDFVGVLLGHISLGKQRALSVIERFRKVAGLFLHFGLEKEAFSAGDDLVSWTLVGRMLQRDLCGWHTCARPNVKHEACRHFKLGLDEVALRIARHSSEAHVELLHLIEHDQGIGGCVLAAIYFKSNICFPGVTVVGGLEPSLS